MLGDVRLARNKTTAVTCHDRLTKSSHDYVAVGIPVTGYPRTDPGVRDLRTGLLPRVSGGEPLHRPWMKNPNPW